MLAGEAKREYQRKDMRQRGAKQKLYSKLNSRIARPKASILARPTDAAGNAIYES